MRYVRVRIPLGIDNLNYLITSLVKHLPFGGDGGERLFEGITFEDGVARKNTEKWCRSIIAEAKKSCRRAGSDNIKIAATLKWLASQIDNLATATQHNGRLVNDLHSPYGIKTGASLASRVIFAAVPAFREHEIEGPRALADKLYRLQPSSRGLAYVSGSLALEARDFEAAIASARHLLEMQATCVDSQRLLYASALLALEGKDFESALLAAHTLLQLHPMNADSQKLLYDALRARVGSVNGRDFDGSELFEKIIFTNDVARNNSLSWTHSTLSEANMACVRAENQIIDGEATLKWFASQVDNIAIATQHNGSTISSKNSLHSLYGIRTGALIASRMIALIAPAFREQMSGPRALADRLCQLQPSSRGLAYVSGTLALEAGDFEAAIAAAHRLLALQAMCPDTQKLLYDALVTQKEPGQGKIVGEVYLGDLSERFCSRPFTNFVTGDRGESFICDCPAYLPFSVGNVVEDENFENIWNGPEAQEIRRSILDGDFSYCSRTLCGALKNEHLPLKKNVTDPAMRAAIDNHQVILPIGPVSVQLSHDASCNLACPTCRTDLINLKGSEQERYDLSRDRVVMPMIEGGAPNMWIWISTGGEAFASKHYRSIMAGLDPVRHADKNIVILTNAQLLNEAQWNQFPKLWPLVRRVHVSCDAATQRTYEIVRRPGKWKKLRDNLDFLARKHKEGAFEAFGLFFVVQKENFLEMPAFAELGFALGADEINFQRVINFGAFSSAEIIDADVANPSHPLYQSFKDVTSHKVFRDPRVKLFEDFAPADVLKETTSITVN